MTQEDKREMLELFNISMQKFATEYIQPQFEAMQRRMDAQYAELKGEIEKVRQELKGEIAAVRQELKGDIESVRQELDDTRRELKGDIENVRQEIADYREESAETERKIESLLALQKDVAEVYETHKDEISAATA